MFEPRHDRNVAALTATSRLAATAAAQPRAANHGLQLRGGGRETPHLRARRAGTRLALGHHVSATRVPQERKNNMNEIQTSVIESQTVRAAKKLAKDTRGASFAEYIILVGLVAIAGMAAFQSFGDSVKTKVDGAKGKIESIPM
jgi:Flp pilus assembly pilin Flp